MFQPNKYTALERLQLFKTVASIGVIKAALIEEQSLKGNPISGDVTLEMIHQFAEDIGFQKCEEDDCDLWFNAKKQWFMKHESKKICRMCAVMHGLDPEF
ncbi:MAG: hypothetical protein SFU91_09605 [Chloroherpetonaceae bacterium]|nr:hypothetical protein [Chloroherpetonaceae bacterium]